MVTFNATSQSQPETGLNRFWRARPVPLQWSPAPAWNFGRFTALGSIKTPALWRNDVQCIFVSIFVFIVFYRHLVRTLSWLVSFLYQPLKRFRSAKKVWRLILMSVEKVGLLPEEQSEITSRPKLYQLKLSRPIPCYLQQLPFYFLLLTIILIHNHASI